MIHPISICRRLFACCFLQRPWSQSLCVWTDYPGSLSCQISCFLFSTPPCEMKKVMQITKYNWANFRYIRNCLTTTAAKLYMNAVIIPHLNCMTSWTQVKGTALNPILSVYKQAHIVWDRKPNTYHHCNIFGKFDILILILKSNEIHWHLLDV